MDIDSESLRELAQQLTRDWLRNRLAKKIDEVGLDCPAEILDALTNHFLSGREDTFVWGDDPSDAINHLTLEFTDADTADIEAFGQALVSTLPTAVREATQTAAKELFRELSEKWPDQYTYESNAHEAFKARLEQRWGKAFGLLRMLYTVSLEHGQEAHKRLRRSKAKNPKRLPYVLLHLHARACQVTGEITTLMENGFADGAVARWRTLHEITVVATVIANFGESAAVRYLDHEVVEHKRALDTFSAMRRAHGEKPESARKHRTVDKAFNDAVAKYGKPFGKPYGWATDFLNIGDPNFSQLEEASGRASLRSHYKLASQNVHAGVMGIASRLGSGGVPRLVGGSSNLGFWEPGVYTAYSLVQMDRLIMSRRISITQMTSLRFLVLARDAIERAFSQATRTLDRDRRMESGS